MIDATVAPIRLRTPEAHPTDGRADRVLGRYVALGLAPMAVLCALGLVQLAGDTSIAPGRETMLLWLGALFAATLGFAQYTFSRYQKLHHLPVMWAILMLIEFVLSPLHEFFLADLPLSRPSYVHSLSVALFSCLLFVCGLWAGLALMH